MAEYADLTTISQHLDESGRLAVEILADPYEVSLSAAEACPDPAGYHRAKDRIARSAVPIFSRGEPGSPTARLEFSPFHFSTYQPDRFCPQEFRY